MGNGRERVQEEGMAEEGSTMHLRRFTVIAASCPHRRSYCLHLNEAPSVIGLLHPTTPPPSHSKMGGERGGVKNE